MGTILIRMLQIFKEIKQNNFSKDNYLNKWKS